MPAFAGMTWWGRGLGAEAPTINRSFLLLFFQKSSAVFLTFLFGIADPD
jgi:hypothetical protein